MMKKQRVSTAPAAAGEVRDVPVRWGVLGAANIAIKKVIPAMQQSTHTPVVAIASRDLKKARDAADALAIPRAYGSYEELLGDPDVEAVFRQFSDASGLPCVLVEWEFGRVLAKSHPV